MINLMGFELSEFEQSLVSFGESKGARAERERIVNFLKDMVEQLDSLRPESYKAVADKMDFRIRVIQMVIKKIEESSEATSIDSGA